jgi:hypothetical protein
MEFKLKMGCARRHWVVHALLAATEKQTVKQRAEVTTVKSNQ